MDTSAAEHRGAGNDKIVVFETKRGDVTAKKETVNDAAPQDRRRERRRILINAGAETRRYTTRTFRIDAIVDNQLEHTQRQQKKSTGSTDIKAHEQYRLQTAHNHQRLYIYTTTALSVCVSLSSLSPSWAPSAHYRLTLMFCFTCSSSDLILATARTRDRPALSVSASKDWRPEPIAAGQIDSISCTRSSPGAA